MTQPLRPDQPQPPVGRSETLIEGPAGVPPRGQGHPFPNRSGTLIERDEEIEQALRSSLKGLRKPEGDASRPAPAGPSGQAAPEPAAVASPYRPTVRPTVAVLTVFDDGKTDGEVIRIRDTRFTIGRTEGDLRIPIDGRISSRHVEITLQVVGGVHRWVVTDLQSTHGMFVRVSRTVLNDRSEFLVGNGRYRFELPQAPADSAGGTVADPVDFSQTRGWTDGPAPFRVPALTELLGDGIGNRTMLTRPEYWIGTDPACQICRPDDPFCEPRHIRLFRNPTGNWHAEHNRSQNGLWVRMSQIVVESPVRFQIGEQRFQIKVG